MNSKRLDISGNNKIISENRKSVLLETDSLDHTLESEFLGFNSTFKIEDSTSSIMGEELEEQIKQMNSFFQTLKIPDSIRDIPEFNGTESTLHEFINNVDEIIEQCTDVLGCDNTPKTFLRAIRNKIKGKASEALNSYGTSTDWNEIKNNLITHYSDKRTETSLIRDLHRLFQNNDTVETYFSKVIKIQSAIINVVRLKNESVETKESIYKEMCLSQFLANLREPMGSTIRSRNPDTLAEAFEMCVSEQNMYYVKNRNISGRTYNWPNQPQYFSPRYQNPILQYRPQNPPINFQQTNQQNFRNSIPPTRYQYQNKINQPQPNATNNNYIPGTSKDQIPYNQNWQNNRPQFNNRPLAIKQELQDTRQNYKKEIFMIEQNENPDTDVVEHEMNETEQEEQEYKDYLPNLDEYYDEFFQEQASEEKTSI